jgi:hypothetical protein
VRRVRKVRVSVSEGVRRVRRVRMRVKVRVRVRARNRKASNYTSQE